MKRGLLLFGLVVALTSAGCGGGTEASKNESQDGKNAATTQPAGKMLDITPESSPSEVVTGLIEAMRSGDKAAKEALLTAKAREETAKHNMPVADNAMPNAQYQVGEPKYLERNPNGAHVSCVLSEALEDGSTQEYEIVWVLRREPDNGWRIAGMAVELTPGTPPQFLNFEDPLDMQKKMDEAAAATLEAEAAATQAEVPPSGLRTEQR